MKLNDTSGIFGPDARLDALLMGRPIVPAPDFVSRTLERVRAEADLVNLARAGDDGAMDALLDHWLSDQPLQGATEPGRLASRARRDAVVRPSQPTPFPWRGRLRTVPAWVQSMGALAAAAAVAFLAFFDSDVAVKQPASAQAFAVNVSQHIPAPVATGDNYYADTSADTSDDSDVDVSSLGSLSDAAALLDNNNVDLLMSATQTDDSGVY
jgi:uncharacterized protein (DUF1684 family)